MNKICGIYLIRNKVNGKCYIGSSANISRRWATHKCPSTWKKSCELYRDFQQYGLENFSFEILEECASNELLKKERYYIESLGTIEEGYNILIPYRPEAEAKANYKVYKDKYNKEHSKEHTLYMRTYRKGAKRNEV